MGLWRGRRQHRRWAGLAALLVVVGLPAARPGRRCPDGVGPGPVTGFDVQGNTVSIEALPARLQVVFHADDLFRIWMAPDGKFTDPANTPPERDGAPGCQRRRQERLPGRHPQGDRRGRLPPPRHPVAGAPGLQGQPAVRPLPGRQPDADLGGAGRPRPGTGARPRRSCPAAPRSSSSAGACRTAASPTGTRRSRWPSATTGTTAGTPTRRRSTSAPPATASCATPWRPARTPSPPPVLTSHEEQRFDAYYFVGDLKHVIDRYTELTGRPFMPPDLRPRDGRRRLLPAQHPARRDPHRSTR